MFRPSLGHLQALEDNRSKITHCGITNARIWDTTMCLYIKTHVILDLFSLRAWRLPSDGRNMLPWKYTIVKYMN